MSKDKKTSGEFENFRKLARELIAVPKKEIDKQRTVFANRKNKKGKPAKKG